MTVSSAGSRSTASQTRAAHAAHAARAAHTAHAAHAARTQRTARHTGHSTRDTFTAHHTQRASRAAPVAPPMTPERAAAVREMAAQARAAGVPPELPVMTALTESNVTNLHYGDRDSQGMFQQRSSWGSAADRTNVARSTSAFINGTPGNPGAADYRSRYGNQPVTAENLGRWAQRVQRSAFPDRYQSQFDNARAMLHAAGVAGY